MRDAARVDVGPPEDANVDAPPSDAPSVDANLPDAGLGFCTFDAAMDLFEVASDPISGAVRGVGVAGGPSGWGLAWNVASPSFQQVYSASVSSSGTGAAGVARTMGTAQSLEPTIAWNGAGYTVAWSTTAGGSFDVVAQGFGVDDRALGPSHTVNADVSAMVRDDVPSIAAAGSALRAVWVAQTTAGGTTTRVLHTRALDASGTPMGTDTALDVGMSPGAVPAITAVDGGGFLVSWVSATGSAMVAVLSASGALMGAPHTINTEGNATGGVDVGLDGSSGAAVFGALEAGVRQQVRAILVDGTGTTSGAETILTVGTDALGSDASIAALAGGYAVAYRALDTMMLRVVLLDLTLHEIMHLDLTSIAASGGRTTIRASGDGNLLIGWADVAGMTARVRAARIRCN